MSTDPTNGPDVKLHLQNIENQLSQLVAFPSESLSAGKRSDDEIDLREVWAIIWAGKWWIVGITSFFAVISVVFALNLPNQYKAEVVLAPAQEQADGMGGLAAQYGGLAAMAGINLGAGQNSDVDQALALVKSWPFLDAFVKKYDIKPLVIAVNGWDRVNNQLVYDRDIYDPDSKKWVRDAKPSRPSEPTSYEVFEAFSKMISISQDAKTGLVRLTVEYYAPSVAHGWVEALVKEINQYFQMRDMAEAARNIDYLRIKINETSIADMQSVFYRMVESQMKTLMLAEVSDEYLMKTVISPVVPEVKSKPKRSLICVLGVVLGGAMSLIFVFLRHLAIQGRKNY